MFIFKNSSSLFPNAALRGPRFQQSAAACTMTFWLESHYQPAHHNQSSFLCQAHKVVWQDSLLWKHAFPLAVSLLSTTCLISFLPPLIILPVSVLHSKHISSFTITHNKKYLNLSCSDSFMAPEGICLITDYSFPLSDWRSSPGRKQELYKWSFFFFTSVSSGIMSIEYYHYSMWMKAKVSGIARGNASIQN